MVQAPELLHGHPSRFLDRDNLVLYIICIFTTLIPLSSQSVQPNFGHGNFVCRVMYASEKKSATAYTYMYHGPKLHANHNL